MLLLSSKKISYLPDICKAWVVILPPTYCMYTSTIFRENCEVNGAFLLTDWEQKHCPWWLDMKKRRRLILDTLRVSANQNSGSTGKMTEEQRKNMEQELQALKEKDDKDAKKHEKRPGRPPSRHKDTSMKGDFTLHLS